MQKYQIISIHQPVWKDGRPPSVKLAVHNKGINLGWYGQKVTKIYTSWRIDIHKGLANETHIANGKIRWKFNKIPELPKPRMQKQTKGRRWWVGGRGVRDTESSVFFYSVPFSSLRGFHGVTRVFGHESADIVFTSYCCWLHLILIVCETIHI